MDTGVGEPGGQNQSQAQLGYEVEKPDDDRVAQRAPEFAVYQAGRIKQLAEVFKTDDAVVQHFFPTDGVGYGGLEGEQDGVEAEDQESNKEGSDEKITIAAVADRFALRLDRWLRLHETTPILRLLLWNADREQMKRRPEYRVQSTDELSLTVQHVQWKAVR